MEDPTPKPSATPLTPNPPFKSEEPLKARLDAPGKLRRQPNGGRIRTPIFQTSRAAGALSDLHVIDPAARALPRF